MLILIYNTINKWRGTILIKQSYKTNKNISRLFYILYFDSDNLCLVYWNADFGT